MSRAEVVDGLGDDRNSGSAILNRYALILDTVAQASSGLPLADIGQRTSLPQATVYRLVHALVHTGFLARGERRKQYVLGPRLLRLLYASIPSRTIRRLAQPILEGLAAEFGETAFVAKLAGEGVETVAVAPPVGERQAFVHPGRTMPFNAAASAKAILAFADTRLVDNILAKNQARFTPRTKTAKHEITAELAQIRQQGFAICDQELDPGVLGYACPIQIGNGDVVYSLGLVGLADRLGDSPPNAVVTSLKSAAEQLSTAIRDQAAMVVDLT